KLSPVKGVIEGKKIVMIDDSIVRGTTSKRIVRLLKEAGATEDHVRISSPRIENPCLYGIDMSTKERLIAANYTNEEICEIIVADYKINQGICAACMTGNYPVLENDSRKEFYRKY